jgi:ribonuclease P protein component
MKPESLHGGGEPVVSGDPPGRLTKRSEFQRVSRGRRVSAEAFTLQYRRRGGAEAEAKGARVGFTVTKKVGNAVVRNRIRRRLKEAVRAAWPLETPDDRDYVLMARREALERRFAALVDDLREAFHAAQRGERKALPRASTRMTTKGRDRGT